MSAIEVSGNEVKAGQILRVVNQDVESHFESTDYYAIWVEDVDGKNERCLLYTRDRTFEKTVGIDSIKSNLVPGRLYPVVLSERTTYLVSVITTYGRIKTIRLSPSVIKAGEKRAKKNPEDIPKKSFLTDLMN